MMDKDIYEILGIEPTADKKIIKRAYAAKVKNIHPEEDQEGWKALHDAYKRAISLADTDILWLEEDDLLLLDDNEMMSLEEEEDAQEAEEKLSNAPELLLKNEFSDEFEALHDSKNIAMTEAESFFNGIFTYDSEKSRMALSGMYCLQKWADFFASQTFGILYKENKFWTLWLRYMDNVYIDSMIKRLLQRKLDDIIAGAGVNGISRETAESVILARHMLDSHFTMRSYRPPDKLSGKERSPKRRMVKYGIIAAVAALFIWFVIWLFEVPDPVLESPIDKSTAMTEMASYLNNKYDTEEYNEGSFVNYSSSAHCNEATFDCFNVYRAYLKEDPDSLVCLVEDQLELGKRTGFDNFQGNEIEAALQREFCNRGLIQNATLGLYELERDIVVGEEGHEENIYPVYHDRYTGGSVEEFFSEEGANRSLWINGDTLDSVYDEELYEEYDNALINGRISLYTKKTNLEDVEDWVHAGTDIGGERIIKYRKAMKTYGMWISSISFPASIYNDIAVCRNNQCLEDVAYAHVGGADAVVYDIFDDYRYNYELDGTTAADNMALPCVACWYIGDVNHTVDIIDLDTGIFAEYIRAIDEWTYEDFDLEKSQDTDKRELYIEVSSEYSQNCVVILELKVLGIENTEPEIMLEDTKGDQYMMECLAPSDYFALDIEKQNEKALIAEGYLMIPYLVCADYDGLLLTVKY